MNYICRLYATVIKPLPIPVLGHMFLAVDKKRVVYTQKCCSEKNRKGKKYKKKEKNRKGKKFKKNGEK
jgi:hypothetical protein